MIITIVQPALKFFPKDISQKIQISSSGIFMIFTLKLHFNKKVKDIGMPKEREDAAVWREFQIYKSRREKSKMLKNSGVFCLTPIFFFAPHSLL